MTSGGWTGSAYRRRTAFPCLSRPGAFPVVPTLANFSPTSRCLRVHFQKVRWERRLMSLPFIIKSMGAPSSYRGLPRMPCKTTPLCLMASPLRLNPSLKVPSTYLTVPCPGTRLLSHYARGQQPSGASSAGQFIATVSRPTVRHS